jgi:hypothetical protein
MKVIHTIAFLMSLILIAQSFLTACPTCLYDMENEYHNELTIGEMEHSVSESNDTEDQENN